jgi:hypothetical protein
LQDVGNVSKRRAASLFRVSELFCEYFLLICSFEEAEEGSFHLTPCVHVVAHAVDPVGYGEFLR